MENPPQIPTSKNSKLVWYELLWIAWPLLFILSRDLVAIICVVTAWVLNQNVFQKTRKPVLRYVWTGLISITSVALYMIIAGTLNFLVRPNR